MQKLLIHNDPLHIATHTEHGLRCTSMRSHVHLLVPPWGIARVQSCHVLCACGRGLFIPRMHDGGFQVRSM